jgi:hypothetical protein
MRTKTLLLTAALGAAGVASAMAQVYSVNTVGYVNEVFPPGYTMFANPLDAGEGNNLVSKLLGTAVPEGTTVYKFNSATGLYNINGFEFGEWSDKLMTLAPGEGAYINNPTTANLTVTFVGTVMEGTLSTDLPAGFSIRSSKVPQAGQLDTVLGFPVGEGDTVYRWDNGKAAYNIYTFEFGEWGIKPVINVGESFFVNKKVAATWTRTFDVSP